MTDTGFAPLLFAPVAPAAAAVDEAAAVRGHAAGYAAGRRAAEEELRARRVELERVAAAELAAARQTLESAAAALAAAADDLRVRSAPVLEESDRALAAAAVELAAALLAREPDRGGVAALERALQVAGERAPRRIRLNPADVAAATTAAPAGVEIVADASVEPGSSIVELERGELDARIGAALDRARAALAEEVAS